MTESSVISSASAGGGLIPDLPDDIAVQCIARVPRSHYRSLALVSRSWRCAIRSPLLYAVRSGLGLSDPLLFLCLRSPAGDSRWFRLDPNSVWNSSSCYVSLPTPPLAAFGSACVALSPALFLLGGSVNGVPSVAVQVFDAVLHRWSPAPRMSVGREFAAAAAFGGRIYAIGGCLPPSNSWAESLDPGVGGDGSGGRWVAVPSPLHIRDKWMHGCAVLSGKILAVADRGGVVYDPGSAQGKWEPVPEKLDYGWRGRAAVVAGILYSYDYLGKIRGYDPEVDEWKPLEGVEKKLPKFLCGATLANLGGLLCLVWEGKGAGKRSKEMVVGWAGIEVSKTVNGGLQGSIVWCEPVALDVARGSSISHCVALEL